MNYNKRFIFNNPIFTDEVKSFIISEDYEICLDDSYCSSSNSDDSSNTYHKVVGYDNSFRPINAYIFNEGIGVDIDHVHGGNSLNIYWDFSNFNNFDEVYNRMLYFINDYKIHSS